MAEEAVSSYALHYSMAEDTTGLSSPTWKPLGHSVIPIMNTLQDIFVQLDNEFPIELPQVAVVGNHSSGKSSVLEALVGRDFLPKGSGICTRRPLVVQLVQTKWKPDGTDEEWGEFFHLPGKRFYDFSEIRKEIQAETEREAGTNKGVSDKQIQLKICLPNILDITLVDLPGITKDPLGDQPFDIEARIRAMIMSYIKHPSCLILAVAPANSDLANSDALQIAGNADPYGYRTMGVITKLDIMDRGTDARNFLLGKVIPLRLGYIGVVNRSQEDILMNRSIKDALIAEEKFFCSHPVYSDLADHCGASQLGKKLNQILVQHIKTVLPELKSHIGAAIVSVKKEHASYGYITEDKDAMKSLLLNILSMYSEAFSSMIDGRNEEVSTSELSGGARILYIFQNIFVKSLEEVDPFEDLTDEDIRTAIQNANGPQSALLVPELPFQVLVRRQIAHLLDPSLQCARFTYDELVKMSHRVLMNELQRFPVLRKRMDDVIGKFLLEGLQPLESRIKDMIEMEMDYIYISPNFIGGTRAMERALQQFKAFGIATPVHQQKDGVNGNKTPASERSLKSLAILTRPVNGIVLEQGVRSAVEIEKTATSGASTGSSWGISSILAGSDHRVSVRENTISKPLTKPDQSMEHPLSMIHAREPNVLMPSGTHSDQEATEMTKLLLRSYYDIVRGIIEVSVPKAIMHFLVYHTKRKLHNLLISKLYSEKLFEELLQESDEIATKRKHTRERLRDLEQALKTLKALSFEAQSIERSYGLSSDPTGMPKIHGHPTRPSHTSSNSSTDSYTSSLQNPWACKPSHSEELHSPMYAGVNSNSTRKFSSHTLTYDAQVIEKKNVGSKALDLV